MGIIEQLYLGEQVINIDYIAIIRSTYIVNCQSQVQDINYWQCKSNTQQRTNGILIEF